MADSCVSLLSSRVVSMKGVVGFTIVWFGGRIGHVGLIKGGVGEAVGDVGGMVGGAGGTVGGVGGAVGGVGVTVGGVGETVGGVGGMVGGVGGTVGGAGVTVGIKTSGGVMGGGVGEMNIGGGGDGVIMGGFTEAGDIGDVGKEMGGIKGAAISFSANVNPRNIPMDTPIMLRERPFIIVIVIWALTLCRFWFGKNFNITADSF